LHTAALRVRESPRRAAWAPPGVQRPDCLRDRRARTRAGGQPRPV